MPLAIRVSSCSVVKQCEVRICFPSSRDWHKAAVPSLIRFEVCCSGWSGKAYFFFFLCGLSRVVSSPEDGNNDLY